MKKLNLSLALSLGVGLMASSVSAVSLEEAIKNVDVSGFARYRYDNTPYKDHNRNNKQSYAQHRFWVDTNFKAALDDNFYGVLGFRYDSIDISGDANGQTNVGANSTGDFGQTFNVRQMLIGYKAANTTIQAGRQVVGSFFTDDLVGTGLKVLNTDIPNVVITAFAFDDLQSTDPDMASRDLGLYNHNLYGLGLVGSFDPVTISFWVNKLADISDLFALDVNLGFDLSDNVRASLQLQGALNNVDGDFGKTNPAGEFTDDAKLYGAKASFDIFDAGLKFGYMDFSTEKNARSFLSIEDEGQLIQYYWMWLLDYSKIRGQNNLFFVAADYDINEKINVGVDYAWGNRKYQPIGSVGADTIKKNLSEFVAHASYQYSKKLNFTAIYSYAKNVLIEGVADSGADNRDTQSHLRFQVNYAF